MNDANLRPPLTWRRFLGQALGLAALMCVSLGGYLVVLKWRGWDAQIVTYTSWDDFIPYQPAWVWVYLIPYVIGPVAIGLIRPATFRWYVSRGLIVVGITLLIFIVIPTQTAKRPPEHGLSGLTAQLYEMMIAVDEPPANAAPSLHVSLTCLLALALIRDFPRWWPMTFGGVGLVWVATLFTRQHHLLDIVTGAALALVVAFAPSAFSREPAASADRARHGD
ncbi:MAG: phosphatase PAP2 family protein [Planctomycetes bacterium]|nr:phosphatase PAP2 family protein [Planctomycetota bacterium]